MSKIEEELKKLAKREFAGEMKKSLKVFIGLIEQDIEKNLTGVVNKSDALNAIDGLKIEVAEVLHKKLCLLWEKEKIEVFVKAIARFMESENGKEEKQQNQSTRQA